MTDTDDLPELLDDPSDEYAVEKEIIDAAMQDVEEQFNQDAGYGELIDVAVDSATQYVFIQQPGEFDAKLTIDTIVRGVDRCMFRGLE